jgi:NADPH-dependent ferric siderophore reductase
MGTSERSPMRVRARREPPPFRRVTVRHVEHLSPRMVRVRLGGRDLEGLIVAQPAASVRLLPSPGAHQLVIPTWNGNEFLLPNGRRPTLRTFTPRRVAPETLELDLEIVIHSRGLASQWEEAAGRGEPAAISGPGRGLPSIPMRPRSCWPVTRPRSPPSASCSKPCPAETPAQVYIEVANPDARLALPDHPGAIVALCDLPSAASPGDALVAAVGGASLGADTRVWVTGEAGAVERIRRHLSGDRGLPRLHAWVRGYWKHGRSGDADDDA